MKQNPRITDEHIVAYLDGELNVSKDFERELRANPSLAEAAKEYSAIANAMAASRADSRFMLSASVDASTKKMLARGISKSRGEVRTAAPAPSAAPIRSVPATRSIKFMWARRRASIGFAFATLLAFLWFNMGNKSELITQVPVPRSVPAPIQQSAPALPEVITAQPGQVAVNGDMPSHQAASTGHTVRNPEVSKDLIVKDLATNTANQTETPAATAHEEVKADPADIMISHRYAKMIKATRAVEVTEQDRM